MIPTEVIWTQSYSQAPEISSDYYNSLPLFQVQYPVVSHGSIQHYALPPIFKLDKAH